jgi:hypothetical protein
MYDSHRKSKRYENENLFAENKEINSVYLRQQWRADGTWLTVPNDVSHLRRLSELGNKMSNLRISTDHLLDNYLNVMRWFVCPVTWTAMLAGA